MLSLLLKPNCLFFVQQGDNGQKGPEGASGKDGSRVS